MALVFTPIPGDELALFNALPDIQVVFDVGARADCEYVHLKPHIELHAFEPNPDFFKELVAKLDGRPNTYLYNVGLADVPASLLYNDERQAFVGGDEHSVITGERTFPLITLDDYCNAHAIERIDFLKIDTEGYDYKVLQGAYHTIAKCHYIQYEHWNNKLKFHDLLEDRFYMSYVGNRNVFCQNKQWLQ